MYEANRIMREAGIATSEFSLRLAAFFVPLCLAALALLLAVEEAGVAGLRVEETTAEVAGIVTFVVPCWTSKYMP
jgi:hypothetical protein